MLLEILIGLLLGIIIGTLTGLFPGIHINLVSFFLLEISPALLVFFSPISLVVFIVALSITHTFIDFIPSIFLGAPSEDTALSVLPGHKMLLEGEGYEAVILSEIGCLIGIILLLPLTFLFILYLPRIYPYVNRIIPLGLILLIMAMVFSEKNKKFSTLLIILFSGIVGYISLNLGIKDPLMPLLSGLFGSSSLIISINKIDKIPLQKIEKIKFILKNQKGVSFTRSIIASLIASPICSFFPALGSSQGSSIGSYIIGDLTKKEFLILVGIVNSLVMSLSFIALYSIGKSRTGSAAGVSELIPILSSKDLTIIIMVIILASIISFLISITITKKISSKITKFSYKKISIITLCVLIIITFVFSGIIGLLVLITTTALGIFCITLGVRRTSLMGCLIIPTILIYLI